MDRTQQPKSKHAGASNVFASSYQSQAQRQDRSYYKKLYSFNANVELAEFSLPVVSQSLGGKVPPGAVNQAQAPPVEQR
jgi:hypothetical protein